MDNNYEYQSSEKSNSGFTCQCGEFSVTYIGSASKRTNLSCGCGTDTVSDSKAEQTDINEKGVST